MVDKCLNCEQAMAGNYCSNCGQKTSTHRFSIQHFFVHDLVHGIFHFDKGFPYTLKELFTRPGHSIREYMQGKRVRHFNYFAAVIFILALDYFISKSFHIDISQLFSHSSGYMKIAREYTKLVIFMGIPFYALASYLLFKKSMQNYTENLVLNIYMLCGWLCLNFLFKILLIFIHDVDTFNTANIIVSVLIYIYIFIFYYQYFSAFKYTKTSLVIRTALTALLILLMRQLINNGLNEIGIRYFH